jgi:hypothetical protein
MNAAAPLRKIIAFNLLALLLSSPACIAHAQPQPAAEAAAIARLIFNNECGGRKACLTSWNRGEEFASLGIGHFIWYPPGVAASDRHFSESFPALLHYMRSKGVELPPWMDAEKGCPWPNRASFNRSLKTPRMRRMRQLLIDTMPVQAEFMQARLDRALPRLLAATASSRRTRIQQRYEQVAHAPMGMYALMDYVNFKGEGTNPKERYRGHGWGLLQVLQGMRAERRGIEAIKAFARSADRALTRRVQLSPSARHESRWLAGWRKRLQTYVAQAKLYQSRFRAR